MYQPVLAVYITLGLQLKTLIFIFVAGLLIALGLAAWLYSLAPQGTLLYTPPTGSKPNFTPSSALGFFVGVLGLSVLSVSVGLVSLVYGLVANQRWLAVAKRSIILAAGYGLLLLLTMFTEKLWP